MEGNQQEALGRLAAALRTAVAASPEVDEALRALGDGEEPPLLLLEVTVALGGQRDDAPADDTPRLDGDAAPPPSGEGGVDPDDEPATPLNQRLGSADRNFLRSLRIRLD